jgi:hypothetical protein
LKYLYSGFPWKILLKYFSQRAGIADGAEFYVRRASNCSTIELPLLIVSMSSPTIGNANVG